MRLSTHFDSSEFACHCCGRVEYDPRLFDILELVREYFDAPVTINSGYRCPLHNAEVGGEKNSYHMKGMAADITVKGVPPSEVAEYLEREYPDTLGIGRYKAWVHVDCRHYKARWKR